MANLQGDRDIRPPLATAMLEKTTRRSGTAVYVRCVDKSRALSCQAASFAESVAESHVLLWIVFLFFGIFTLKLSKFRDVRDYPSSEMVSLSGEQGQGVSRWIFWIFFWIRSRTYYIHITSCMFFIAWCYVRVPFFSKISLHKTVVSVWKFFPLFCLQIWMGFYSSGEHTKLGNEVLSTHVLRLHNMNSRNIRICSGKTVILLSLKREKLYE